MAHPPASRARLLIRLGSLHPGRLLARGFARLTWPLLLRFTLQREHRGFRIFSFIEREEGTGELAAARVALALDLIAACDPRRLERLRRDMPNIRVIRDGGGHFESDIPTCVVDWPTMVWHPIAYLAQVIVHEGAHARLHAMGVGYPAAWRRRIERRCLREELAFLRRLPDGGARADERARTLERALDTEWWQPHLTIERPLRAARAEHMPGWLIRLLERRRARLLREAAERDARERRARRHNRDADP
jgi:hypothetical protein